MLIVGMALSFLIYNNDLKKDLYILSFGIISLFGLLFLIAGILVKSE